MSPQFFTGRTGRAIKQLGKNSQLLASYLCYSPHANSLGLYYLPINYIVYDLALTQKEAIDALKKLSHLRFINYDMETEFVWVCEMARHQNDEQLKPEDNRVIGINREYEQLPKNPFIGEFYDRYVDIFHLKNRRGYEGPSEPLGSPFEGTSLSLNLSLPLSLCGGRRGRREGPVGDSDARDPVWPSPAALQNLYNEQKPTECPKCETVSPARSKKLSEYLRSFPSQNWWEQVFVNMHRSLFLRGLKNSADRKPIARGLDWLIQKGQKDGIENCVKVFEGKYEDKDSDWKPATKLDERREITKRILNQGLK